MENYGYKIKKRKNLLIHPNLNSYFNKIEYIKKKRIY